MVAAATLGRGITLKTFTDSKVNRPQIQKFLRKIEGEVRSDAGWAGMGHHHPAQATITLKDGRRYSGETSYARGYPDIPLTTEEILDKYRKCSGLVLSTEKIARLSEMVLNLEA